MPVTVVILLAHVGSECGNLSTGDRIRSYLESRGMRCVLVAIKSFPDRGEFHHYLRTWEVDMILAIHAAHTAPLLADCPVPYVVMFGGTDINEMHKKADKLAVMTANINKARYLIGFSDVMIYQATKIWPGINKESLLKIPQGIQTNPSTFFLQNYICHQLDMGIKAEPYFFTIVGGIRPVKDPLYLVEEFSLWHKKGRENAYLVLIGPKLDEKYAIHFADRIRNMPGIINVGRLSQPDTHAAIQQSFALVNSSLSEGMATAILEAMDLEVPVVVKNIPNNAAIVSHRQTGLLYDDPKGFISEAENLIQDDNLRHTLVANAKSYLLKVHCPSKEEDAYVSLVKSTIGSFNGKNQ